VWAEAGFVLRSVPPRGGGVRPDLPEFYKEAEVVGNLPKSRFEQDPVTIWTAHGFVHLGKVTRTVIFVGAVMVSGRSGGGFRTRSRQTRRSPRVSFTFFQVSKNSHLDPTSPIYDLSLVFLC